MHLSYMRSLKLCEWNDVSSLQAHTPLIVHNINKNNIVT